MNKGKHATPIVLKQIHKMLLKRADPEGKIQRDKLFEVIAERVGRIGDEEKGVLIFELQNYGIIKSCDKIGFVLCQIG